MRTDDLITLMVHDLPNQPRKISTVLLRWWPAAAAVAGIGFLAVAGVRSDLLGSGIAPTLIKFAFGALLALAAITGALQLSRPEARPGASAKWLMGIAVFLGLVVTTDLLRLGLDAWSMRLFGKGVLACLTLIPALAAVPLAVSIIALRRGATTAPAAAGALAGLASAGLAILAYGLFCNEDSPLFISTWYSMAALIAGFVGALLGRAFLKW